MLLSTKTGPTDIYYRNRPYKYDKKSTKSKTKPTEQVEPIMYYPKLTKYDCKAANELKLKAYYTYTMNNWNNENAGPPTAEQ